MNREWCCKRVSTCQSTKAPTTEAATPCVANKANERASLAPLFSDERMNVLGNKQPLCTALSPCRVCETSQVSKWFVKIKASRVDARGVSRSRVDCSSVSCSGRTSPMPFKARSSNFGVTTM